MRVVENPYYPGMTIIEGVDRIDFHCKRCGGCCRYIGDITLFPQDIPRIAKHLGLKSGDDFLQNYAEKVFIKGKPTFYKYVIKAKSDNLKTCILYDEEKKACKIHEAKPPACFFFPFVTNDYRKIDSECVIEDAPCIQESELGKGKKLIEYVKANPLYEEEFDIRMRFERLFVELKVKQFSHMNKALYSAISKRLFEGYSITDGKKEVEERLNDAEEWAIFI